MTLLVSIALAALTAATTLTPAPPPAAAESFAGLYLPDRVERELAALQKRLPAHVRVETIGTSALGRPLQIVRLGRPSKKPRPVVFAMFGLHPDEHDMNTLGMYFVDRLAAQYSRDAAVTALLDRCAIVILPMANPDGTVYDLTEAPKPFQYRRNRRPHAHGVGTNLNRNWGGTWKPGDEADWPGEVAFSEPETRAVRDWLRAHGPVAGFFDFHSGTSGFNQGMVLLPEPETAPGAVGAKHARVANAMASRLNLPGDRREPFWVIPPSAVREHLITAMTTHIPEAYRAQAIASVPADTHVSGAAYAWALGELKATSLGLELSRAFDAPDAAGYAKALQADYATRAPRYLDGFEAAVSDLLAP